MLKLFSFYWDCGRVGSLEGLFIATQDEVDRAIGKQVYFGEVLGKHSEIYGSIDPEDITVVSEDQEKIQWLRGIFGDCVSGYNPLEYISDSEEEE
jgi:hypothetical protein